MNIQPYLNLSGRCEEALEFYKKAVGAEVTMMMRMKESPDPAIKPPPGMGEKIMHSEFKLGDSKIMASDGMGPEKAEFKGVTLSIGVKDDAEAKRVFAALSKGGSVQMPLVKTFWTSSFGMFSDSFGVPWMVNAET